MHQAISFPSGNTDYHFNRSYEDIDAIVQGRPVVIITDKNLFRHYQSKLERYKTIVIPAGESSKSWEMAKQITEGLLNYEVDKTHVIVGVGGGMVTDITGFVAATYMRGLDAGFVPASLLAMTDASIGGKNGVNIGKYKNMMGAIRQPAFILFDTAILQTLPDEEWSNGFAEIIKYGCIFNTGLLEDLSVHDLSFYKNDKQALGQLIQTCAAYKTRVVQEDEHEKGIRKLLNFGHTIGHAIENNYNLSHGKAVASGMVLACKLSEKYAGLKSEETLFVKAMLEKYHLPSSVAFDLQKVMHTLRMDKKRQEEGVDFIMLETLGKAVIRRISFNEIENGLS